MSNVNVIPTQLGLANVSKEMLSDVGMSLDIAQKVFSPVVVDFSSINLPAGECLLIANVNPKAKLYDVKVAFEALGANTALSIGVASINFSRVDTIPNVDGKYVVDSSLIQSDVLASSFATTSALDIAASKVKMSGVGYVFGSNGNNKFIVIKNTGSANITSGKFLIKIETFIS